MPEPDINTSSYDKAARYKLGHGYELRVKPVSIKQTVIHVLPHSNAEYGIIKAYEKPPRNVNCREHGRYLGATKMSIPHVPGVYEFCCIPTGKIYVGSAVDVANRYQQHCSKLRRGIHYNSYLQRAWNKYGEDSFVFFLLEETALDRLRDREQFYISSLRSHDSRIGFNLRRVAFAKPITTEYLKQSRLFHQSVGIKLPYSSKRAERTAALWRGRKHRPESIEKMRVAKLGKPEPPNAARAKVEATSKVYVVTDPEGNEATIKNLSAFCREHGLIFSNMQRCASGGSTQHKGWKCRFP